MYVDYVALKGTVELNDQVEVLTWLAKRETFIDMNRVGIYGWSYGGYLSLMGLVHFPKLFKVSLTLICILSKAIIELNCRFVLPEPQ
jgi:dipeptidyl aminopeptidase/acylaminoacyl peptidase